MSETILLSQTGKLTRPELALVQIAKSLMRTLS